MRINPSLISPALTVLYRLWVRSMRYDDKGRQSLLKDALDSDRPCMLAIWHSELFALTGFGSRYLPGRLATMASDSNDGEVITQLLQRIGYEVARGSSTRGGMKALIGLKKLVDRGLLGVITVDGPRGPRHKVKDGAVYLAHKTGSVLFPVRSRLSSLHVFERSWDKFQLPMPFSRCEVFIGDPLEMSDEPLTPELLVREGKRLEEALRDVLPPET